MTDLLCVVVTVTLVLLMVGVIILFISMDSVHYFRGYREAPVCADCGSVMGVYYGVCGKCGANNKKKAAIVKPIITLRGIKWVDRDGKRTDKTSKTAMDMARKTTIDDDLIRPVKEVIDMENKKGDGK
jgi:hypothetical protein